MNEQKNSVPEQAEQIMDEQQPIPEQEASSDQAEPKEEQINYKSELEKANSRIAELELECDKNTISKEWLIAKGSEQEVIEKAHSLVEQGFAKDIVSAVGMLKETFPDVIKPNKMPRFSYSTSNGASFGNDETAFTSGFKNNKPMTGVGQKIKEW